MACKAMVEKNVGDDATGRSSDEEPEHFKKPARHAIVPPTLVNFFYRIARGQLKAREVTTILRLLENEKDIPCRVQIQWLKDYLKVNN